MIENVIYFLFGLAVGLTIALAELRRIRRRFNGDGDGRS